MNMGRVGYCEMAWNGIGTMESYGSTLILVMQVSLVRICIMGIMGLSMGDIKVLVTSYKVYSPCS